MLSAISTLFFGLPFHIIYYFELTSYTIAIRLFGYAPFLFYFLGIIGDAHSNEQIMRALDGDSSLEDLTDGTKNGIFGSSGTSEYDTAAYNADMIKFREMIANQEFNSSEYGATSDYGLNPSSSSGDSSELDHHQGGKG